MCPRKEHLNLANFQNTCKNEEGGNYFQIIHQWFFLHIQVNLRSLGEAAGLQAGDVISAVNGQDIGLLRHKEAQDCIKMAGNNFVLTILRYDLTCRSWHFEVANSNFVTFFKLIN